MILEQSQADNWLGMADRSRVGSENVLWILSEVGVASLPYLSCLFSVIKKSWRLIDIKGKSIFCNKMHDIQYNVLFGENAIKIYVSKRAFITLMLYSPLKKLNGNHQERNIPSNAHISTPFFQKTVFFSKIFFGKPPSNFLKVCLNSENM
jgi:hypothetical protein